MSDGHTDGKSDPKTDIIEELRNGDRTRGALADATGWSENTVSNHLNMLLAEGTVERIHEPTGLYSLSTTE